MANPNQQENERNKGDFLTSPEQLMGFEKFQRI
jgi:hypothetical protein